MGATTDDSFLSRPPKLSPPVAIVLGVFCIPLGFILKGSVGGALVGGGIGAILMGVWDFSRLRYIAWRRSRGFQRHVEAAEDRAEADAATDRPPD